MVENKQKQERLLKLGGDIGNSKSDFVGENNYQDSFDSCIVENFGEAREKGDTSLEIYDRHFTIGQGAITGKTIEERNLDEYEALAVAGICRYIRALNIDSNAVNVKIDFCIGLPTGDYTGYKAIYKELFTDKDYAVKYASDGYKFKINNIRVVPQGSIVAYNNKRIFEGIKNGFIIDFGSFTFDVQELIDGQVVKTSKKSYDEGVMRHLGKVSDILKRKGVTVTDDKDIERFIINGRIRTKFNEEDKKYVTTDDEDIVKLFDDIIRDFAEKAKRHFPSLGASEKTYCIGGGAIAFEKPIRKYFNDVEIPADAARVNAKEYYHFAGGR